MIGKWLFQLLIVLFGGITVAFLLHKPVNWGMVLYGLGAMILNIGVLLMK